MSNAVNHSYFFTIYEKHGWNENRSFFTYYSEFGRSPGWVGLETILLCIVFLLSVAANSCLAFIVVRYKQLRTVTNYFILNLALADILLAVSIPAVTVVRISENWILGDALCRLMLYFQFVCGTVLLWTLTMISFERYRRIVQHPIQPRLSVRQALVLITATWAVSSIIYIPVAVWFQVLEFPFKPNKQATVCTLVFPNTKPRISFFFISYIIIMCLIPIIWLVYNYYAIFCKILANEKRWQQQQSVTPRRLSAQFSEDGAITSIDEARNRKHYRTVKILLLDVCITIIMWSPIILMMGLIHYDSSRTDGHFFLHSHNFIGTLLAALTNTCVNPLLYGFLNTNFHTCLKDMLHSGCKRRQSQTLDLPVSRSTSSHQGELTDVKDKNAVTQPVTTCNLAVIAQTSLDDNYNSNSLSSLTTDKSRNFRERWETLTTVLKSSASRFTSRFSKLRLLIH